MTLINLDKFNLQQQKMILACEEKGFNPSGFAKPEIDAFKMQLAFQSLRNGNDLSKYLTDFNYDQLDEIRIGMHFNVDVSQYAKPETHANDMHMLRLQLEDTQSKNMN